MFSQLGEGSHTASSFHTFIIVAALVLVAVLLARLLRPAVNLLENYLFERRTRQKIVSLRAGQGKNSAPVRVRQTDIMTEMTRQDRQVYVRAEKLLEQGDQGSLKEAARLFESIRFQRRAIDILEANGMIDEACAVLIRMKAIGRAGVIYERNQHFEKAASCFTAAGQHESAGQAYLKLAIGDYRYFNAAADSFLKGEKWEPALKALQEVLATPRIVAIAFERQKVDFLASYLGISPLAQEAFRTFTAPQWEAFFAHLPVTPRFVWMAKSWARQDYGCDHHIVRYVQRSSILADFFWKDLDPKVSQRLKDAERNGDVAPGAPAYPVDSMTQKLAG